MGFFQEHRALATVMAIGLAIAVTALLFYLSSTADDETGTAPAEEYADTDTSRPADGENAPNQPAADIGQVDFEQILAPQGARGRAIESIIYLDVDGDGADEALVLVRGEGDLRPLDWYLYGVRDGVAVSLFERTGAAQGEVTVDGPRVVEREGLYAVGEDPCCPSETKTTFYVLKDGSLTVSKVERSPAGASR